MLSPFQRVLLAVAPLYVQVPPIFATLPRVFAAAALEDADSEEPDIGWIGALALAAVALEDEERTQPPRPGMGGQRITEEWLRSLSSRECLWRFRYVGVVTKHKHFITK